MFSDIVQRFDVPLNPLYKELAERRTAGKAIHDLISGNANQAGFFFPKYVLQKALEKATQKATLYKPNPLGQIDARRAIAHYYADQGRTIPESQILVTPGTSVSYWYLFKMLANPGDEILGPSPSYPLLDSIAELCGVKLTSYRLRENERWEIDFDDLTSRIGPKTKAILLISPHNPTGAVATDAELSSLCRLAAKRNLPIISDEVFSPFVFSARPLPRPSPAQTPLLFTLNGLSKMLALPGMKIGWIAVTGDSHQVRRALQALDMMSDTFLPVSEFSQFAVPMLLEKGRPFLKRFQEGVRERISHACQSLEKASGISFIRPEGGFYITVRLDQEKDEEQIALRLLQKEGLLVHPGYFYSLEDSHLVFSFLQLPKLGRRKQPFGMTLASQL